MKTTNSAYGEFGVLTEIRPDATDSHVVSLAELLLQLPLLQAIDQHDFCSDIIRRDASCIVTTGFDKTKTRG